MFLKEIKNILRPIKHFIQLVLFQLSLPIKRLRSLPLKEFCFNYFSQNGEDGIVEEIFRRLKINSGWIVEFGAWDGKYASNTFHLLEAKKPFNAVYIEGDGNRYQDLLRTAEKYPIIPINSYVEPEGKNSLDNLLNKTPTPKDFELLSIDVDGIDYHLWESLKEYIPKIVIIEIDRGIPSHIRQIHSDEHRYSSALSMTELGTKKSYTLVCNVGNLIFVRNDLLKNIGIYDLTEQKQNLLFTQKGSVY